MILIGPLAASMTSQPVVNINGHGRFRDLPIWARAGEFVLLHKQKPFIKEDLRDSKETKDDAYVENLYTSWRRVSEENKQRIG